MEILFVIDSVKDLESKIELIRSSFECDIKFFVNAKLASKVIKSKYIVEKMVAVYNKSVNITFDKYVREEKYVPQPTTIYHSSASINIQLINKLKDNIRFNPTTVYVKGKFNWFKNLLVKLYQKTIKLIFGMADEYASCKLQYISEDVIQELIATKFRNHIFSIRDGFMIECDKDEVEGLYNKIKFQKYNIYNMIVFCVALIGYVLIEKFFQLRFWMYLLIIAIILAIIVSQIVLYCKNVFDERFKK